MEKKLNGKPKKPITNGDKLENKPIRDEKGRIVSGVLNPEGRPPETLNFSTKWFAFMERIAKENGVSTSELDHKMMVVAFKQMQDGKFPYWKDVNDRLYGQATQKTDITSQGEKITGINYLTPNGNNPKTNP